MNPTSDDKVPPALIDLGRLPVPGPYLVGRDSELALLDSAWEDPAIHVLSLVAFGGVGKSALVSRWLDNMAADGWRGAERVLDWSFFSQGSQGQDTTAEPFINYALRILGDSDPNAGSPHDRGGRLAGLMRQQRTLLVLDGVEPLQYGLGPLAGRLKDPGLAALLKGLAAANLGLCLVTTRKAITDLHGSPRTAPQSDLEKLSPEAGVELLRCLGARGKEAELRAAAEESSCHALTLTLLGSFLRRAHGGDIRKRREVDLRKADDSQGGRAFAVIAAYARWLGEGPELATLRLLGFFDRPAEAASLAALRAAPSVRGLNDSLMQLSEEAWQLAVASLREHGLLAAQEARAPGSLDAHPLVRAFFAEELVKSQPDAWREGNLRLFEQLRASAPEFPDTLEAMQPLYAAIVHGCRAGRHQEALDEVLWRRIDRGEAYSVYVLGAFGSELTALASLFDRLWDKPVASVTAGDQAYLLNSAGYLLRDLGRLSEAVKPMEEALAKRIEQELWKSASSQAGSLGQLSLSLGEVARAVGFGEQCVQLAERSGEANRIVIALATQADALHQSGRWVESDAAFSASEEVQRRQQRAERFLYSFRGFQYCDFLLSKTEPSDGGGLDELSASAEEIPRFQQACLEVVERATLIEEVSEKNRWLLDGSLAHLALGRAYLGLSVAAARHAAHGQEQLALASEHLDRSIEGLRTAGEANLPRGLLARGELRMHRSDFAGAAADLDEALEIAERDCMRLFECEAHLGWTRLHLRQGHAGLARDHLARAARLVQETGYGRRQREVTYLERRVAELPPEPVEAPLRDFFVSYNRSDRSWAAWISWTLEDAGYSVILQDWDFLPGGNFVLEMQKAATGSRKTIMVLSDAYLQAMYTQPEWAAAFVQDPEGEQRRLIPVRVASCSPDGLLKALIYADLVGLGEDEAKDALLAAASGRKRAKPSRPSAFPGAAGSAGGTSASPAASPAGGTLGAASQPGEAPMPAASYPGPAPPAGNRALVLWRKKLDFLLEQEVLITDAEQRFALLEQIEHARQKIQSLGG
jgi:tetratricopeptide (TPR) repeat protein